MAENHEGYQEFEGLAVKTAAAVWAKWREALNRRGIGVEDAAQEGRAVLLEILPKLDDPQYVQAQRVNYVKRCVWGRVNNWAKAAARDGDLRDLPDPPEPDVDGLLDLRHALAQLGPIDAALVLARHGGGTYAALGKRYGMSGGRAAARVKKALAKLKKIMHA